MNHRICLLFVLVAVLGVAIVAQDATGEVKKVEETIASDYSKDYESIDSIMKATYEVISGGKGEKRDWVRFRTLFHPDARLIPSGKNPEGVIVARARTPDQYIEASESFLMANGFFEQEISRKTEVFGNIAHVFSTYEARNSLSEEKPFLRGINSFQLLNDGKRWWVMTIYWMAESPQNPIPAKYLNPHD